MVIMDDAQARVFLFSYIIYNSMVGIALYCNYAALKVILAY